MELPLFHTVLCPGVALRSIFEERYRLMVERCVESGEPFGVVLIREERDQTVDGRISRVGDIHPRGRPPPDGRPIDDGRWPAPAARPDRQRGLSHRGRPFLRKLVGDPDMALRPGAARVSCATSRSSSRRSVTTTTIH
jgi:hypothetical protein